jgi:hypothetical protein
LEQRSLKIHQRVLARRRPRLRVPMASPAENSAGRYSGSDPFTMLHFLQRRSDTASIAALSLACMPPVATPRWMSSWQSATVSTGMRDLFGVEHARDVGQEDQPVGVPCRTRRRPPWSLRSRCRSGPAVRPRRRRRPGDSDARRRGLLAAGHRKRPRLPTNPRCGIELLGGRQPRVDPGQSDCLSARGIERRDELRIHRSGEHLEDRIDRLAAWSRAGRRTNRLSNAALLEEARHLRPAAVDDGDGDAGFCRHASELAARVPLREAGSSSRVPPILIRAFTTGPPFPPKPKREVEVLDRLARRALDQVVDRADDDTRARWPISADDADVAEIGMRHGVAGPAHFSRFV